MTGFAKETREEARLIMLRALNDETSGRLNSELLRMILDRFAIARTRDWVHEELRFLADIGAVEVTDAVTVKIAELTQKGRDHVERRTVIEGVKRPSLGG